jgi:pimeloyl-ACP methyl ester carboxylesterase
MDRSRAPDLQYDAASTPEEDPNRILLVVHGTESAVDVTLPTIDGVAVRVALVERAGSSRHDRAGVRPGDVLTLPGPRCTCSGCNDATRTPVVCPFGFGGRFESWLRRRAPLLPFLLARRRCAALHRFRYARSPRGAA